MVTQVRDISYGRTMDPDVAITNRSPCLQVAAQASQINMDGPRSMVVHRLQHGPRYCSRSWAITRPMMITAAIDLNTDSGLGRATDPDMVPSHGCDPDIMVIPGKA